MKLFKRILSFLLVLVVVCGMFSAAPFAAQSEDNSIDLEDGTYAPNQVIVMFKDSAVDTDTLPSKGELAAVGADFGEMMDASSSGYEA